MSPDEVDPLDGKKIISGPRGSTTTLRCQKGEALEACVLRHTEAGWELPPGAKMGRDQVGPVLTW